MNGNCDIWGKRPSISRSHTTTTMCAVRFRHDLVEKEVERRRVDDPEDVSTMLFWGKAVALQTDFIERKTT